MRKRILSVGIACLLVLGGSSSAAIAKPGKDKGKDMGVGVASGHSGKDDKGKSHDDHGKNNEQHGKKGNPPGKNK